MRTLIIILSILISILISTAVHANDHNTSYSNISELKSWDDRVDIYFKNGQEHVCSGGHKARYLLDSSKNNHLTFLLSAFMSGKSVQLAYSCINGGYPWVDGVRLK